MPRSFRRTLAVAAAVASFAVITALIPPAGRAADDKQLQRVKGVVGYQATRDASVTSVVGRFLMPDDYFAITQAKSAALLTLPDSSIVGLGENTDIQVGAFNQTAAGPGSTVTVNNGTLRFDIRRPAGGTANYHFLTPTSQIAVRGTIGLLSLAGGNTSIACLVCAADSVTVTVGTQTFPVLSGQFVVISATGAVVTGPLTSAALGTFSATGVSTSTASGAAAATAGIVPGATAGAASGALGAVIVGAGVVSGVTIAATKSNAPGPIATSFSSPAPLPTATPTPAPAPTASPTFTPTSSPSPSPSPVPTPTATASANVSIVNKARAIPTPAPVSTPPEMHPAVHRP